MASILATATEYANRNFVDADCSDHTALPNINNPCICMLGIGDYYIGSTGRSFVRTKRETGEICNDTDFTEVTNAVLLDGSRTTDLLKLSAGTTTKSQINFANGVAKTTPADGDFWREGTDLKVRFGSTTYTLTKS